MTFIFNFQSSDGITPSITELDKFEETLDGPESNGNSNLKEIDFLYLIKF